LGLHPWFRTWLFIHSWIFWSFSNWLRAGWPTGRSSSPGGGKNFLFFIASRLALGSTRPPIQWVRGPLSLGVKWSVHEVDHLPQTSDEFKKIWLYMSTPPYVFMVYFLIS
jgi:hypothetical protein